MKSIYAGSAWLEGDAFVVTNLVKEGIKHRVTREVQITDSHVCMNVQSSHEDETAAHKASCTENHWEAATPATLSKER